MKTGNPWCVNCEIEVESVLRVLHDCPNAMALWIDVSTLETRN